MTTSHRDAHDGPRSQDPAHESGTGRPPKLDPAVGDRGRVPVIVALPRWVIEARAAFRAQRDAAVTQRAALIAQIGTLTGADRIIANVRAAPLFAELDQHLAEYDVVLEEFDVRLAEALSADGAQKD